MYISNQNGELRKMNNYVVTFTPLIGALITVENGFSPSSFLSFLHISYIHVSVMNKVNNCCWFCCQPAEMSAFITKNQVN